MSHKVMRWSACICNQCHVYSHTQYFIPGVNNLFLFAELFSFCLTIFSRCYIQLPLSHVVLSIKAKHIERSRNLVVMFPDVMVLHCLIVRLEDCSSYK